MQTFELDGRRIAVNRAADPAAPVVYLNAYAESEAQAVLDALNALEAPEVTLVVAIGFDWNNEMSPWAIDAIAKHIGPMKGEADKTFDWIMKRLVPAIETDGDGRLEPRWRALAGYSLAGLFALYAATRMDAFSRIGSMSGSLWYPDFAEYFAAHALSPAVEAVYFSLGDAEHKSRNEVLASVRSRTEAVYKDVESRGVATTFVLNSGNHFRDADARTAAGIAWLAAHPGK